MTQSIAILGRQPALGLAELESLYGSDKLRTIGEQAALIDVDPAEISFSRLGGTIKLAKLLTILPTTEWHKIENYLAKNVIPHARSLPDGKMSLGLSAYGLPVKPSRINASGLELKKLIKSTGRSIRVVPNKTLDLSSAQVLHNNLTGERAWELLVIRDGNQTYVAQSTNVQDITAYAARDQARPKRDARVGMLPPKLAQIIINLAVGKVEEHGERSKEQVESLTPPTPDSILHTPDNVVVLDPFCGTGVILQEALLMGFNAYGTDLEPRMIEYSDANLKWLRSAYRQPSAVNSLEVGDATVHHWQNFDTIACEIYLGRPFSALPTPNVLQEVMQDVDTIHKKFLQNLAAQTKPGFRACIAVPAWKTPHGFKHLRTLDHLEELGYTRQSFVHVEQRDMVYHRPEQIVARELVVLIRK